jgi:hypothetical protein
LHPLKGAEKEFWEQLIQACRLIKFSNTGVWLGRGVREVRQHPDDHEFESQRWQWISFPFWFAVDCERW